MSNREEYITLPCSQEVANLVECENPHLAKLGLSGFEIFEYLSDKEEEEQCDETEVDEYSELWQHEQGEY